MDPIKRLSTLIDDYDSTELLTFISNKGVIAGGSMIYALLDDISPKTVGDIDVFVNNEQDFNDILSKFNDISSKKSSEFIYQVYQHEYEYNTEIVRRFPREKYEPHYSIVTISLINGGKGDNWGSKASPKPKGVKGESATVPLSIQIILSKFKTPMDLIQQFDLDYVQCAFHQGNIIITPQCQESHQLRQINWFSDTRLKNYRLIKAISKGFKAPILSDTDAHYVKPCHPLHEVDFNELFQTPKKAMHIYLPEIVTEDTKLKSSESKLLSFNDLEIIRCENSEKGGAGYALSPSNGKTHTSIRNISRTYSDTRIVQYKHFVLNCKGNQITKKYITCEVDIETFYDTYDHDTKFGRIILKNNTTPLNKLKKIKVKKDVIDKINPKEFLKKILLSSDFLSIFGNDQTILNNILKFSNYNLDQIIIGKWMITLKIYNYIDTSRYNAESSGLRGVVSYINPINLVNGIKFADSFEFT